MLPQRAPCESIRQEGAVGSGWCRRPRMRVVLVDWAAPRSRLGRYRHPDGRSRPPQRSGPAAAALPSRRTRRTNDSLQRSWPAICATLRPRSRSCRVHTSFCWMSSQGREPDRRCMRRHRPFCLGVSHPPASFRRRAGAVSFGWRGVWISRGAAASGMMPQEWVQVEALVHSIHMPAVTGTVKAAPAGPPPGVFS